MRLALVATTRGFFGEKEEEDQETGGKDGSRSDSPLPARVVDRLDTHGRGNAHTSEDFSWRRSCSRSDRNSVEEDHDGVVSWLSKEVVGYERGSNGHGHRITNAVDCSAKEEEPEHLQRLVSRD